MQSSEVVSTSTHIIIFNTAKRFAQSVNLAQKSKQLKDGIPYISEGIKCIFLTSKLHIDVILNPGQ